jgi:NDP-sugar pyrophosphorylase family protein
MDATPKRAMVLAAGKGTRMQPLTDTMPKPLVKVAGRALLDHVLDRLGDAGVERAVVNVHHSASRSSPMWRDARRLGLRFPTSAACCSTPAVV